MFHVEVYDGKLHTCLTTGPLKETRGCWYYRGKDYSIWITEVQIDPIQPIYRLSHANYSHVGEEKSSLVKVQHLRIQEYEEKLQELEDQIRALDRHEKAKIRQLRQLQLVYETDRVKSIVEQLY